MSIVPKKYRSENHDIMKISAKYKLLSFGGKNDFVKEFSLFNWEAPIIQQPHALKEYLAAIGIIGAKIDAVDSVGAGWSLSDGTHISSMYPNHSVKGFDEKGKPVYEDWSYEETVNWLKDKRLELGLEVDEPIIIFTDKGRFEIDYRESSTLLVAKDTIPLSIIGEKDENKLAYVTRKIFDSVIGLRVVDIEVEEIDYDKADFEFTGSYGLWLSEEQEFFIGSMKLVLDNGWKLDFYTNHDWGYLRILGENEEPLTISGKDVNSILGAPVGSFPKD